MTINFVKTFPILSPQFDYTHMPQEVALAHLNAPKTNNTGGITELLAAATGSKLLIIISEHAILGQIYIQTSCKGYQQTNAIRVSTVWIQIRPDNISGLPWTQAVCKGYKQTTQAGLE